MELVVQPLSDARPDFAAEAIGIDIAAGVPKDVAAAIENAMDRYGVLVFRNQQITDAQQYAFSQNFGPMEKATGDIARPEDRRLSMDINDISNLDRHSRVLPRDDRRRLFGIGNMLWHSDSSFKATPSKYSLLSGRVLPDSGGNTEFADMRAAWNILDQGLQQECLPLICEHSQIFSRGLLGFTDFTDEEREKWRPVRQPLVRRHPATRKLSLYLASHAGTILGWPVPEARMFLRDLIEHATQRQFVYTHQWRQWDLVMWDNRVTMHRARRYDHTQPRDMHRTTVAGTPPMDDLVPEAARALSQMDQRYAKVG